LDTKNISGIALGGESIGSPVLEQQTLHQETNNNKIMSTIITGMQTWQMAKTATDSATSATLSVATQLPQLSQRPAVTRPS